MKGLKIFLRKFERYRKKKMRNLESLLYRVVRNNKHNETNLLPKKNVLSILIIRNNKRIGNMYFLIPFIRQVRENYPDAHITLMLNQSWQGEVFENMGIDGVCYSAFSFKRGLTFLRFIYQLKNHVYDLIIVPVTSAGDSMICAMLSGRNKVSISNPYRNTAFTHTFKKNDDYLHAALSSLYLVSALGGTLIKPIAQNLVLSEQELVEGRAARLKTYDEEKTTLAFFRGARGKKILSNSDWLAILDKFDNAADYPLQWIEILSPDITSPLNSNVATFSSSDMRHLASYLKHVDGFICCDTGPLHLADAAGANCIGLYNKTDPKVYGVMGENSVNIEDIHGFDAKSILTSMRMLS